MQVMTHFQIVVSAVLRPIYINGDISMVINSIPKVVATIKHLGRRHMLVVEHGRDGQVPVLRGVISLTQIERQLGHPIDMVEQVHNLAEISASFAP